MNRLAAFSVALIALLAAGLVHGRLADRWNTSAALTAAVARMDRVPLDVGAWHGKDSGHIPVRDFEQTGALRHFVRIYEKPGCAPLEVILMCGRPGKMSVHTPEICYRGVGYEMLPRPELLTGNWDQRNGRFWRAQFSKPGGKGSDLQLYWSWNSRGVWTAPDNPRWAFMGEPFLYKLYISQTLSSRPETNRAEVDGFWVIFSPALKEALFAEEKK